MEKELFELVGKIVAWVAAGGGGAFLFIKFWGEKWIENKFSKDLELFKAQKLHEFDLLLTRKTAWHEKEHEVLSNSWKRIMEAKRTLGRSIAAFREHPDLANLDEKQIDKFIERNEFTQEEKEYFSSENDKNEAFNRISEYRDLEIARAAFSDFHQYFENNRIFLRPHIKEKFEQIDQYIWEAWVSKKMSLRSSSGTTDFVLKSFETEKEKISPLIEDIEKIVQKELFPEQREESEGLK